MPITQKDDYLFNPVELAYYSSKVMAKQFITAQYLNRQVISAPTVLTYLKDGEKQGELISSKNKKPRPIAEGSHLTEIRTSEKFGETKNITTRGFKLVVTDQQMNNDAFDYMSEIRDMQYTLARIVETEAIYALVNEATRKAPTIKGSWSDDGKTMKDIQKDLVDLQEAYYTGDDYDHNLNIMFYSPTTFSEILKELNFDVSRYKSEEQTGYNNFTPNAPLNFLGIDHLQSKFVPKGEALGWDRRVPPATIYYGVDSTLGTPDYYAGLEPYAPLVRTSVERRGGIEKETEIQMAVSFAVTVNRPSSIFHVKGL